MDEGVDRPPENGYDSNTPNDTYEIIQAGQYPALNDPSCEHVFVSDPEDTIGDAIFEGCIKCPVGRYVQK